MAAWLLAAGSAWAQPAEPPPPPPDAAPAAPAEEAPGRALETEQPAAPQEAVEPAPADKDGGESRVLGRQPPPDRRPAPPPVARPAAPKQDVTVKRGPDGKVIVPPDARPLGDPLRPRVTAMESMDRVVLTALQTAAGVLPGVALLGCGLSAVPCILGLSAVDPWIGPLAAVGCGGGLWSVAAVAHAVASALGVAMPSWMGEADPLASGAALLGTVAVDAFTVLLGGLTATAIVLRWSRSPEGALVPQRLQGNLPPDGFRPPQAHGVDVALAVNFMATLAMAAALAPVAGVVAYTLVSWVRGIPEEAPAPKRTAKSRKIGGNP